jgi:putative nucleotidyltransferase with HDIG domain
MRLGTKWLFHMAVGAAVSPLAQSRVSGYDMPPGELLTHSVAVAVGTEQIARMLKQEASGYAFTAGLLHDLGKIVLGTFVAVDAKPIKALAFTQNVSFDEAERQVLGIDHAEAGGVLLEHWRLPAPVVEAVRWHHRPENSPNGEGAAALVHVADDLCLLAGLGTGSDGANYKPSRQAATRLHMSAADTEKVMFGIMAGLGEWRALLAQAPGRE